MQDDKPSVVLICHEQDRLDVEGLASWLANTLRLAGLIIIRDPRNMLWRAAKREIRRVGWLRFVDVIAFRAFARLRLARRDAAWKAAELARLRRRYPADLDAVPRIVVSSPNTDECRGFMRRLQPDLAIARCKVILKRAIFEVPRAGTFVLHPGICPEYRNAHGCFWALTRRDLDRVGMTLLRVDPGVDTGPIFLHGTYDFDEVEESHSVIQYRAVFENLPAIGAVLTAISRGETVEPIKTDGRESAVWGQPQLTAYLRWKWHARRSRHERHIPAVS
jgi:folate-dependent phosphoribosylglycinamide formyltransferase PurN